MLFGKNSVFSPHFQFFSVISSVFCIFGQSSLDFFYCLSYNYIDIIFYFGGLPFRQFCYDKG